MIRRLLTLTLLLATFAIAHAQELVGEVVVRGLKNVPESTIVATMRSKVGQTYVQSQLTRDRQSIEALGFFQDVRVYGQLLEDNRWRIVVEVVEWPIVNSFKISGNTVFTPEEIQKVLQKAGVQTGGVFNVSRLEAAAQAVSELYRTQGYFARINKFEPDTTDPTILVVEIVEARVNKIVISGNTRTKRGVFEKIIDTREGDLLNQRTWSDDLRRIVDTRWFDAIKPDSREPELGKVDLLLDVTEGRTGSFNIGLQLDPRSRLAGILSLSDSNFRGSGKSMGVSVLQSAQGLGTSVKLDYGDPFFDRKRSSLNVSVYSQQQVIFGGSSFGGFGGGGGNSIDDNPFSQRRTGASIQLTKVVTRQTKASFGVKGEAIDTINFLPDPGEEFIVQDGTVASLALGVVRNRRDNSVDPAKGDWLKLLVEPSFSNITSVGGLVSGFDILGSNYYTRLSVDYRVYFSSGPTRKPEEFDEPRRVVAGRIYAGTIQGVVPFSEQFFVGGASGMRGYSEDRYWGRHTLLAQLEYRHPLQRSFNLVGFVDYGGAWDGYPTLRNFTQRQAPNLHLGYGIGVNFKTAFGPIRLDIGFDEQGSARTHFLIGGSF